MNQIAKYARIDARRLRHRLNRLIALLLCSLAVTASADSTDTPALQTGETLCREGALNAAVPVLRAAHAAAQGEARQQAAESLAAALLQQRQWTEARALLKDVLQSSADARTRALAANDLGTLELLAGNRQTADESYTLAGQLAPSEAADLVTAIELNRLRLQDTADKLPRLDNLLHAMAQTDASAQISRYTLNIGEQARRLGAPGLKTAFTAFSQARHAAAAVADKRLLAEAQDRLGQLYEDQGRTDEAMQWVELGLVNAQQAQATDLLIPLSWRQARLWQRQGQRDSAIVALRNAVGHIESIREDIPVTYLNGQSSFRDTLAPIYLMLADLLLQRADEAHGTERATLLQDVLDTVELIKRTELEDYLGNRCRTAQFSGWTRADLPDGAALLYPLLLPERVVLILASRHAIEHFNPAVEPDTLQRVARRYAQALRNPDAKKRSLEIVAEAPTETTPAEPDNALADAQALHHWLLAPVEPVLKQASVKTLVIVPDGVLRRVPFSTLHDGERYAIEHYAFASVPGLNLLRPHVASVTDSQVMIAGMSQPGPVVDKLTPTLLRTMSEANSAERGQADESIRAARTEPTPQDPQSARSQRLKRLLALPGVKQEVDALGRLFGQPVLLDSDFTRDRTRQAILSGQQQRLHLATHGVFGPSGESTFIMTYDDLLTLDDLRTLLSARGADQPPIDLLTLSACQTAQGDDRAPLGLAGVALQAQAGAALGSLWPVSDAAASQLMRVFYETLSRPGINKSDALRSGQLDLLRINRFRHPFYWAPFVLVGDWQ